MAENKQEVAMTMADFKVIGEQDRGMATLIFSPPDGGKTWQCSTLPHDEVLLLDLDGGYLTLQGTGIHVFSIDNELKNWENIYRFLREEKHPFKYIFLDNFSKLENRRLNCLTEDRRIKYPRQVEWGNSGYAIVEDINLYKDLTNKGIDVIFTAWDMVIETEDGSRVQPKLMKSIVNDFCGAMDNVWYLQKDKNTKSTDRYMLTESTGIYYAKTRTPAGIVNPLPKLVKNPELFSMLNQIRPFYSQRKEVTK